MFRLIAKDEAGASGPEYAVLLLLLVGSVVVAIGALNTATTGVFSNTANGISDARNTSPAASGGLGRANAPGLEMQQQGPVSGTTGASGFAPGHKK